MNDKVRMQVEIDDEVEPHVNAVMEALSPLCRDPDDPAVFDGRRGVDVLGACAALIFAGIPEELRESQMAPWFEFVRKAANNIERGGTTTLKVKAGMSRPQ